MATLKAQARSPPKKGSEVIVHSMVLANSHSSRSTIFLFLLPCKGPGGVCNISSIYYLLCNVTQLCGAVEHLRFQNGHSQQWVGCDGAYECISLCSTNHEEQWWAAQ